ncbi:uncharacterized protein LOC131671268 [Phymastichus coffea]|uniref:uncharacterized protein LOC131671268 n=1 Tax=Phymastichus coffea TaxID=108790 RepID=UPI00273CBE46|nr:uncharacterized protein LOC131671268 [Phymastichus coffea]
MYHRTELIFLLSLLLQLMLIRAHNARNSYKEILVQDRIEEKFQLIGPRALLKYQNFNFVSDECARDLAIYERGIDRQETWALQMLDSSSKLPTGILRGNIIDVGMYDECIETHGISMEGIEISGQHCTYSINRMVTLEKRIFFNPVLSICMPKRCSNDDLFRLINGSIDSDLNLKNFGLSVSSASCTNTDYKFIDKQLIIFAIIMFLYHGFLFFCTALHLKNIIVSSKKRDKTVQTLTRFSYVKNIKAILSLKASENDLPVIHGLRALNTFWLILLHEVFFQFFLPLVNFMDLNKWFASWEALILLMGMYSVDTFLVLSGFLTAFTYFNQRRRNINFNIFSFYLHRFIRLAPSIAAVLSITIVVAPKIPLIVSGPRFDWLQNIFIKSCGSKWLPVLFFIPNLVDKDNYCLQHLWSIAVDMQFMWISPLILYALHKKPKAGLYLLIILLLSSILSYATILGINKYSAIYFTHRPSITILLEAFQNIYEMPYTRASPWLLGLLFGYIATQGKFNLNKTMTNLGWLLAFASFAFCTIGTKTFTNEEYEYNLFWEITFAALSKPLWGFGICWIIYESIYKPHGFVTTILSSKYFLPFSRMSYSLCIVHVLFPVLQAGTTKAPKYFSDALIFHSYLSNLVLDLVIAFIFSASYEMPMRIAGEMIFKRNHETPNQEKLKANLTIDFDRSEETSCLSITMPRYVKFAVSSVVLLVFLTCRVSAKYINYAHVLENPDYKDALSLLAPEKMFTNHDKTLVVYTDDEAWSNVTCYHDLLILEEAIIRREAWALLMLDASSKLGSGLLQGNLIDLGQYDECIAVHSNSSDNDIRGRHCMYSISATQENVTIPINPTLSVCLPTTCSAEDIVSVFSRTISRINKLGVLNMKIVSTTCSPVDPTVWDLEFTVCIAILVSFATFLIACTVIEVGYSPAADYYRHPFFNTLAAFSLRKNAASILNMDINRGTLPAIHGIRFFSMAWVVLGHEHVISLMGATVNTLDFMKWVQSWNSLYIFIAPFTVDTFFVISGFLMTYLFLKQIPKKKRFNIPMYYLHRYFRLTPAVIALLVFTIVIVPKIGSGARWDVLLRLFTGNCRNKWWPHLLYLQNFIEKDNMCLAHLWYLAVDMQFFWISPLILYPLYRKPKLGLIILSALFLVSLAITASVVGIRNLPVVSFTHVLNTTITREVFYDIYVIPYHRAGPWLVGIFLGYEVATHNRQFNRGTVIGGWITAIASFSFCTFGTRYFVNPNYEYNAVWETFFSAVSRPIWAIGVCWLIYASINNRAGPLSYILSCRIFLPLSRLSYCVYLVHFVLQLVHAASLRTSIYFSAYYVWRSFFGTLIFSIGAAFFLALLFESPIIVLEKMLLNRKRESQLESQRELEPNVDEDSKHGKE